MDDLSYLKYIICIVLGLVFLIFFSKSAKYSDSAIDKSEDPYYDERLSDFYFDSKAWAARIGAIIMILWWSYELYNYFK